ncbi:MAG: ATP-binding cassette domain-containing protein [Betaproteobacteria bacterium]
MIRIESLVLSRGTRRLLDGASLAVHAGQKVGLVGSNGCGKSSLFALLLGELLPDAGSAAVPPAWVVAHVEQEVPVLERPAREFVIDGDAELRSIEAALSAAEASADGHAAGELHGRLAQIHAHAAPARAAVLMAGLGFSESDAARPVGEFSGGWRVRLQLARALMARSDLLLLDEPTNHLDLDAVIWLEQWLKSYRGTLLAISHDREFLDNVVDAVCHVNQGRLRLYAGGFGDFERARAEEMSRHNALRARQERDIARLEDFVNRFRAKATKARQAQSRLKALDRIQLVARAQADVPLEFAFDDPGDAADPLVTLDDCAAGYGATVVLRGIRLEIRPGARVGLLGRNGAGKSTLTRLIAGRAPPSAGQRHEGRGVRIGYFTQHTLEQLRDEHSALDHLARLEPAAREQDLRDFLGGFGFHGDDAMRPCGPLSGGEKARLCLALLCRARPHLLLLDEPTNHLDMGMRGALTLALQSYPGAVVLVSHDRSLLRAAVDEFLLVADGRVVPFDGDLDDYRAWLLARREDGQSSAAGPGSGPSRRDQRRAQAEARNRAAGQRRPVQARIAVVEREMARLEGSLQTLETRLSAPDIYEVAQRDALAEALREQGRMAGQLVALEEEWLALQEQLEAMAAAALAAEAAGTPPGLPNPTAVTEPASEKT